MLNPRRHSFGRAAAWCVVVVLAAVTAVPADGSPAQQVGLRFEAHEPQDCSQFVPAAVALPEPNSDDPPVVDVIVLSDDVTATEAERLLERTSEPFARLGLRMRMTVRPVHFDADGEHPWGTTTKKTISGAALIAAAKAHLGGKPPPDHDLVYVLTMKDLWDGRPGADESARNYSIVGEADCIGGIRYDDRAFAIGEVRNPANLAGITFSSDGTASVAAHEIGHLLGGHHHYAVCGTGAASLASGAAELCTVMWPETSNLAFEFSPANGAVVSAHADRFAR